MKKNVKSSQNKKPVRIKPEIPDGFVPTVYSGKLPDLWNDSLEFVRGGKSPINPSRTATLRVAYPAPIPTSCDYCAGEVVLETHFKIYGIPYSDWPFVYECQCCSARVGLHPYTAIPLGTLADGPTRDARKIVMNNFNRIWLNKHMSRDEAYGWISEVMKVPRETAQVSMFSLHQCKQLDVHVEEYMVDLRRRMMKRRA